MKPDAYLWQLTLNTGYSERRYRHDVEDHEFDAIRAMNPLKAGLVHIPAVGDADYYLQTRIDHAAGATTFTVFGENTNHRARTGGRADCHLHPGEP